jgi:dUTP pyrophosphatase
MRLALQRLDHARDLPLPGYATPGAAGMDLYAAIADQEILHPGDRCAVPCGIAIALPPGYEAQVRPRSGLALKHGISVLNAPGTIDSDYRGEIKAILINHSTTPFAITRGMKIAQLVVAAHATVVLEEVRELDVTARGQQGFGSTGLHDQKS